MTPKRSELIRAQVPLGSAGPKGTCANQLSMFRSVELRCEDRGLLERSAKAVKYPILPRGVGWGITPFADRLRVFDRSVAYSSNTRSTRVTMPAVIE